MAEFASMRASVTGSAVPMQGYSYGSEMKSGETSEETGNIYVDLDSVNVSNGNNTEEGADGVGNTVTFGGVETFATNSAAGSTIGAMTEGNWNIFVALHYSFICLSILNAYFGKQWPPRWNAT